MSDGTESRPPMMPDTFRVGDRVESTTGIGRPGLGVFGVVVKVHRGRWRNLGVRVHWDDNDGMRFKGWKRETNVHPMSLRRAERPPGAD